MNGWSYPAVHRADVARELYVTSVGRATCLQGVDYPPAGHPFEYSFSWSAGRILGDFALMWLVSGAGEAEVSGLGRAELRPGRVLFLPPGTWHRYRPDPATGWVEQWLCLNGTYLHRLAAKHVFPTSGAVLDRQMSSQAVAQLFARIHASANHNSLSVAALAFALLALILQTDDEAPPAGRPAAESGDALVDAAVDYIWSHSHLPLNVEEVARQVSGSRRNLERAFKACWSCGVAGEIQRARLERARDLLAESGMSVKEAGYAAGFEGARRFIESHRRAYGVSPNEEIRRRAQGIAATLTRP